ncbi:MAG: GAF domain-containing sensor histidine kinase [Anaerolineales bacterium]|nr:MAG: GAF domain-containing sensor histidine kinase [Anaerolineales bacterium]
MNASEAKIEWLFINLGWFFLVAVMSVIGLDVIIRDSAFPSTVLALLIFGGVANIIAVVSLLQNSSGKLLQRLMLLNDIALTLGFIAGSSKIQSQLLFVSLIPITVAAMRISWFVSILLTSAVVGSYWLIAWSEIGFLSVNAPEFIYTTLPQLINGLILVIAGSAVSYIGTRIKQSLLIERKQQEKEAQLALQSAQKKIKLIFELASTLSATLNYELILEAALDVSDASLREFFNKGDDISQIGMILLYGMDQTLYIAASQGLPDADIVLRFPAQEGAMADAVASVEPIIINHPYDDPELKYSMGINGCQQAIIIPLRAGFDSYGFLMLASPEEDIYSDEFVELLVAVSNQAVLALQNASLYQSLMDDKDRLVTIEEDARKHLARNLHDGPTQIIAAIAMRLNYIRLLIKKDPDEAVKELAEVEDMARMTTKDIRQMLFILRPLILESQGLVAAVEQLRQKLSETNNIEIHMEADSVVDKLLTKEAKGSIFYIIEEAINNVKKHAKAQNIWIRIYPQGLNVITEVKDDGVGFDVSEWENNYAGRGNMGLMNLQERAELAKGQTAVRSTLGEGTTIIVTIPAVHKEHTA